MNIRGVLGAEVQPEEETRRTDGRAIISLLLIVWSEERKEVASKEERRAESMV